MRTTQAGTELPATRITPLALADALERDCRRALDLVEKLDTRRDVALRYEVADIRIWAHLGLHLAEKLRGAVALETFRATGKEQYRQQALERLGMALSRWDAVVGITRPLYDDMRLTHYNHNSFDANPDNLFHWARVREEVARDLEVAREAAPRR